MTEPIPNSSPHPAYRQERNPVPNTMVGPILLTPSELQHGEWLAHRPSRIVAEAIEQQLIERDIDPESVVLIGAMELEDELSENEILALSDEDDDWDGNFSPEDFSSGYGQSDSTEYDSFRIVEREDDDPEVFEAELAELHKEKQEELAYYDEQYEKGELHKLSYASLGFLKKIRKHPDDSCMPPEEEVIQRELGPEYNGRILVVDRAIFNARNKLAIPELDSSYISFNTREDIDQAVILEIEASFANARTQGLPESEQHDIIARLTNAMQHLRSTEAQILSEIQQLPEGDARRVLLRISLHTIQNELKDIEMELSGWEL